MAFAGNSLLCRLALRAGRIDPVSFTLVRLWSGALVLVVVALARGHLATMRRRGSWISAAALAAYAVLFSLAYVRIDAGLGALVLFGAVQVAMLSWGLRRGERLSPRRALGLACALAGLVILCSGGGGGATTGALLSMALAGVAWGVYSIRGRGVADPIDETGGNFARGAVLALAALPFGAAIHADAVGASLAVASGAVTSGLGYVIWYMALRGLTTTTAAIAQLAVPVLAAGLSVLLLGEEPTARLVFAGSLVLAGVAIAVTAGVARTRSRT